jgi:hypothetical protein
MLRFFKLDDIKTKSVLWAPDFAFPPTFVTKTLDQVNSDMGLLDYHLDLKKLWEQRHGKEFILHLKVKKTQILGVRVGHPTTVGNPEHYRVPYTPSTGPNGSSDIIRTDFGSIANGEHVGFPPQWLSAAYGGPNNASIGWNLTYTTPAELAANPTNPFYHYRTGTAVLTPTASSVLTSSNADLTLNPVFSDADLTGIQWFALNWKNGLLATDQTIKQAQIASAIAYWEKYPFASGLPHRGLLFCDDPNWRAVIFPEFLDSDVTHRKDMRLQANTIPFLGWGYDFSAVGGASGTQGTAGAEDRIGVSFALTDVKTTAGAWTDLYGNAGSAPIYTTSVGYAMRATLTGHDPSPNSELTWP